MFKEGRMNDLGNYGGSETPLRADLHICCVGQSGQGIEGEKKVLHEKSKTLGTL